MQKIATQLLSIINERLPDLNRIPEEDYAMKPTPEKWSKKEIMGHMIDSAQNNIRRFITAQYEDSPYIVYNQDKWVLASNYQEWKTTDIIQLWYLLNQQVCFILRKMDASHPTRECRTQAVHTLEWLAEDYVKHLLHHLHVVLELEPVAYP